MNWVLLIFGTLAVLWGSFCFISGWQTMVRHRPTLPTTPPELHEISASLLFIEAAAFFIVALLCLMLYN